MIGAGDLGDILVVQGTYSQAAVACTTLTTLAHRESREPLPFARLGISYRWDGSGPHLTGLEITALCADLQIVHKTRKKPKKAIQTFAGKTLRPEDYEEVPIETEDFEPCSFI